MWASKTKYKEEMLEDLIQGEKASQDLMDLTRALHTDGYAESKEVLELSELMCGAQKPWELRISTWLM